MALRSARRFLFVPIAGLVLWMVGFVSPAVASTTITVNPGQSIQAAVDAASPGDTIVVKPGFYNENVVITKDGITLKGFGATLHPGTPVATPCDVFSGP